MLADPVIFPRGLYWIPAAAECRHRYQIGVRFNKAAPAQRFSIRVKRQTGMEQVLHLPDRTILLQKYDDTCPLDGSDFDTLINLDHFDPDSPVNHACQGRVLVSAAYGIRRGWLTRASARQANLDVIGDSGGFQVKYQRLAYLHPDSVIEWMNATCSAGFALDIPPAPVTDWGSRKAIQVLSRMQRHHNDIFTRRARPDLHLINVAQGSLPEQIHQWIATVDHSRFNSWAVSYNNGKDHFSGALRAALILYQDYSVRNWLHIFGLSAPTIIPALAWLGRHLPITIDSSTHFEGMRSALYLSLAPNHDGRKLQGRSITRRETAPIPLLPRGPLPCTCPICKILDHSDVLFHPDISIGPLIVLHNLFVLQAYTTHWRDFALQKPLDIRVYRQEALRTCGEVAAQAIDFIEMAIQHGVEYASRAFPDPEGLDAHDLSSSNGVPDVPSGSSIEHLCCFMTPEIEAELPPDILAWHKHIMTHSDSYYHQNKEEALNKTEKARLRRYGIKP